MDVDDEAMQTQSHATKRKIHSRIESPTVESVTTGCKRIKLVNTLNQYGGDNVIGHQTNGGHVSSVSVIYEIS